MNAKELKAKRTALQLTQTELAKRLRVTLRTIARWESGDAKIPHIAFLAVKQIAQEDGLSA